MPRSHVSLQPAKAPATLLDEALAKGRRLTDRVLALPAVAKSVRAVVVVASGLRAEPITLRAAALTYLSFLSLVPLLAVVFSVFQAVVGTREMQSALEKFILDNLAVGMRENVQHTIEQAVTRATGATFGGLGFVFLVASSVSLLMNIEAAFNHIFRAPRPRSLSLRFGIYWCLLTLGPILLSLSIALTAFLESARAVAFGPMRHVASVLLPLLITCGAFTLLYLILPAVQVKRRAAMLGAIVAGVMWETAKIVYTIVSAHSVRRDAIYGSLAAIPTFLLWLYVSWIIVLFGARVAYAAQTTSLGLPVGVTLSPLERELLVARVMRAVAAAFHHSQPPVGVRTISTDLVAEEPLVRSALQDLAEKKLVREVANGGWVPSRPLSQITLRDVREAARGHVVHPAPHEPPLAPDLDDLVARWDAADDAAGARLNATYEQLLQLPETAELVTDPGVPARA